MKTETRMICSFIVNNLKIHKRIKKKINITSHSAVQEYPLYFSPASCPNNHINPFLKLSGILLPLRVCLPA